MHYLKINLDMPKVFFSVPKGDASPILLRFESSFYLLGFKSKRIIYSAFGLHIYEVAAFENRCFSLALNFL